MTYSKKERNHGIYRNAATPRNGAAHEHLNKSSETPSGQILMLGGVRLKNAKCINESRRKISRRSAGLKTHFLPLTLPLLPASGYCHCVIYNFLDASCASEGGDIVHENLSLPFLCRDG